MEQKAREMGRELALYETSLGNIGDTRQEAEERRGKEMGVYNHLSSLLVKRE